LLSEEAVVEGFAVERAVVAGAVVAEAVVEAVEEAVVVEAEMMSSHRSLKKHLIIIFPIIFCKYASKSMIFIHGG
jgi:hypothetical protein